MEDEGRVAANACVSDGEGSPFGMALAVLSTIRSDDIKSRRR
jgi:hypothetical protein